MPALLSLLLLMKKLIAIIAILALVLWAGNRLWYRLAIRAVAADDQTRVLVDIPEGSATSAIAVLLKEKDVIRSARAFRAYVEDADLAAKLQAGSFVLRRSMDTPAIAAALSAAADGEEMIITIPEGYTVTQIDALLAEKGLLEAGEITTCAQACAFEEFTFLPDGADLADRGGRVEGYLFPDTYFVLADGLTAETLLERLLHTFREKVIDVYTDDIASSGRSLHDIITMASLVEKETRTPDERTVVAGILWKRLDEGIGLYVDASNRYITEKPTAAITRADLEMDTPYNLRKYRGLPPGPIAGPGRDSIEAALQPESSPYYYYLHGTDGQIRYAVTNDEHNANKARYLR